MLMLPSMLVEAATRAGIAVPDDLDDYDKNDYPHWHILCATQLNRPMQHGEHWDNAVALAKLDSEALKTVTVNDLQAAGVGCGC